MSAGRAAAGPSRASRCSSLLVAITLLGLLMAALFGGLRLGARVWESAEARLAASARVQVLQEFLRQRLTEALPLEVMMLAEDGRLGFAFRGTGEEVRFAGALPEHLGAARLALTLAVDRRSVTIDAVPLPNNRDDLA